MKEFIINKNDAGQRLDKFLTKSVPLLPQALMYKYIRLKRIKVNGKRCEISTRLCEGDCVSLYVNDEFFVKDSAQNGFMNVSSSIDIIYEDENILLINKRPGLVVHEDESGTADTLINRIKNYLYKKGEFNPDEEASFVPALCNRIDRNTGGIVIAAKNAATLRIMNDKIKNRELTKLYLCIVHGIMEKKSGIMTAYLLKDSSENKVKIFDKPFGEAKIIKTRYRVLDEKNGFSLIEVDLLTGRTHQIRAHFAHIGHPLAGDGKYGTNELNKAVSLKYQALYAYKLIFDFTTDAGHLEYLNGKEFEIKDIWFRDNFLSGDF